MASRSLPLFRAALRPVVRASSVARFTAPAARATAVSTSRTFAMSASRFKAVESGLMPLYLVGPFARPWLTFLSCCPVDPAR